MAVAESVTRSESASESVSPIRTGTAVSSIIPSSEILRIRQRPTSCARVTWATRKMVRKRAEPLRSASFGGDCQLGISGLIARTTAPICPLLHARRISAQKRNNSFPERFRYLLYRIFYFARYLGNTILNLLISDDINQ